MKAHIKESDYLKIRRKYRIEAPEELKEFWNKVELDNISDGITPFHFYNLKILSLQDVIDFEIKKVRSWFKEKDRLKYVLYYIPIAEIVNTNNIMIFGFDHHKSPIGLFFFNNEIEPVFIAKELQSLFTTNNIQQNYGDDFKFLKEKVFAPLILEDNEEYNIDKILAFLKNCMSKVLWGDELNIEKTDSLITITFQDHGITRSIMLEDLEMIHHDETVYILNFLNTYIWTSSSIQINHYGFYLVTNGIVFLTHDELIEYVRKGLIPFYFNVTMPQCIFIDRINNYVNEPATEEDKALMEMTISQVIDYYEKAGTRLKVLPLRKKDIPSILDYYFDFENTDLILDGIDELKIKSEEDFHLEIENTIQTKESKKKRTYLTWIVNQSIKGHAYFERIDTEKVIQFQFYYREISWRAKEVIDELFSVSIEYIIAQSNPETIISKVNIEDTGRIDILTRNGFEQTFEETSTINEIGLVQSLVIFEKSLIS